MVVDKRACVVVLGDVGRSPRMQYHALSLAKEGYSVDIIGYSGSAPHSDLLFSQKISFHYMNPPPSFISSIYFSRHSRFSIHNYMLIFSVLPRFITYLIKVLWQTWFLVWTLFWISKPSFYLVQNPPSIPTLPVCWFIARIYRTQLAIDWHNYGMLMEVLQQLYFKVFFSLHLNNHTIKCLFFLGYTIMGLTLGPSHFLTRISHFIEAFFGRFAGINMCVTKAMSQDLHKNWGVWYVQ